ncbi:MAG: hypothetical protein DI626_07720, partial [Micavibrio aeruginosavorus]
YAYPKPVVEITGKGDKTPLSQNGQIASLLENNSFGVSGGIDINLKFLLKSGDFIVVPLAKDAAHGMESVTARSDLQTFLGKTNEYTSWILEDSPNLKDNVACPALKF